MEPAPITTRRNVERMLAHLRIPGVVIVPDEPDQDPSRVKALDTQGRLLWRCYANPHEWSRCSGRNHGKGVRGSFRSMTTPSMQVTIWETNGSADVDGFCEIDFDQHSPNVNFVGHAGEVLEHTFRGNKTDPRVIARGLDKLGITA